MNRGVWSLAWLLVACGAETGNPEGTVELLYNARTTDRDVSLQEENAVRVDNLWLRLGDVRGFTVCDTPQQPQLVFRGLGLTDHAGPDVVDQSLPQVELEEYCRLEVTVAPGASAPAGAGAARGASVAITGSLLSDSRDFSVTIPDEITFELPLDGARPPSADEGEGAWLLLFDVGEWLERDELLATTGDPIEVSLARNADVLSAITQRLADGIQLYLDEDADGVADPGEARIDVLAQDTE